MKTDINDQLIAGKLTPEALERAAEAAPPMLPKEILEHRSWGAPRWGCTDAKTFVATKIPPTRMVTPWLPEGTALLAGSVKTGKSRLLLSVCDAVARGGVACGLWPCAQGDALLVSLEDPASTLQQSLGAILGRDEPTHNLYIENHAPALDEGLLERLDEWVRAHPSTALICIDTLALVRSRRTTRDVYQEDYKELHRAQLWCRAHPGIALVFATHESKAGGSEDDHISRVSGSTGLSGAVDTIATLSRRRFNDEGVLDVSGRRAPATRWRMRFNLREGLWACEGLHDGSPSRGEAPRQRELIDLLGDGRPRGPKELALALGTSASTAKTLLARLVDRGVVANLGGAYYLKPREES